MFKKLNKATSVVCKLHNNLAKASLVTICKSFIRPHLDYGDIIRPNVS